MAYIEAIVPPAKDVMSSELYPVHAFFLVCKLYIIAKLIHHREPHMTQVTCFLMRLTPQAALGGRTWSPGSPPQA